MASLTRDPTVVPADQEARGPRGRPREIDPNQLEAVAFKLFAEHGYSSVTIEEIVRVAGISRRSFFRYFSDKYELLRAPARRRYQLVCTVFATRPTSELTFAALCESFVAASRFEPNEIEALRVIRGLSDMDPVLFERTLSDAEGMGEQLTDMVAERLGIDSDTDMRADLLVRLVRAGAQTARRRWYRGDYRRPLTDLLREAFSLLEGPLLAEVTEIDLQNRRERQEIPY